MNNVTRRSDGLKARFLRLEVHQHEYMGSAITVRVLIQLEGEQTWDLSNCIIDPDVLNDVRANIARELS